jgi:hypothetical protein
MARVILDAVAVAASATAAILAWFQVEDGEWPISVLWFALSILLVVVVAETYDLLTAAASAVG